MSETYETPNTMKFGSIKCRSLTIVDKDGVDRIFLGVAEDIGAEDRVEAWVEDLKEAAESFEDFETVFLNGLFDAREDEDVGRGGALLAILNKNEEPIITIIGDLENGGLIQFYNNNEVTMSLLGTERGGHIHLHNNGKLLIYDTDDEKKIRIGVSNNGHGRVITINKDGEVDGLGGNHV